MHDAKEVSFIEADGASIPGKRWKNPDGTLGGWVAENARVHPSATVEETAVVLPGTVVNAGERVAGERPIKVVSLGI